MVAVKVVVSDVDGTILNSHHQISQRLKEAIRKIAEKNIPFVLASARSPEGMKQISQKLAVTNSPLAAFNGALVIRQDQIIYSQPVEKEDVKKILAALKVQFPTIAVNLYSANEWYVDRMNQYVKLESEITQITPIVKDLDLLIDTRPVHKLLLIGAVAEITAAKDFLAQEVTTSALYLSKDNYLEVTHRTVSKESALQAIAQYYNITTKEIMTFGDNYNDIPMLVAAGVGVAMNNAPLEVKKVADRITKSNDEDGVAHILEEL
ncbi:hypothetical protein IGI65_002645 [Enterococcus sp. DIV0755b]|uniref:Cof-type HAD-IIB family hydrolase n=1 Tax=Enterococcus sp. DIV0755b TaxID=2774657 RepID=UPI003F25840E